jgi:hypothetical protein
MNHMYASDVDRAVRSLRPKIESFYGILSEEEREAFRAILALAARESAGPYTSDGLSASVPYLAESEPSPEAYLAEPAPVGPHSAPLGASIKDLLGALPSREELIRAG